ncbi:MAG: alanine--tRNA ligase [Chloroflexota bacterium]|nr:MAG: alanine--tRNA ligase [Chloroflexota bacterium]
MKPQDSAEVRQAFLDFFEEMGHRVVPSSPLPVHDNPTLLFTNAGMNQFVDTFLGHEKRGYSRAASSQKCMRVQGKHNDLENVGPSPRHHTFFEMLGNFSFGDYFKEGAIRYAYDFLTTVCEIPADRLYYTVHVDDDDAYRIWVEQVGVSADRVLRMGDKTNFWMMGDVGPCGPTSEVHYDWGPKYCTCDEEGCSVLLDNDCGRWLEIWNLVFMQFNQHEDGSRTPLPKPGVDTGLGLERITAVIEQQPVNYDTDLFLPLMDRVQELLSDDEEKRQAHQTGYRVVADHGRAAAFMIADGVLPGNVGRGYVLRMIIRRAARFGRSLGFNEPFLAEIAQVTIDQMGDVYPELVRNQDHIRHTVTLEEERFDRTLDAALAQLDTLMVELHHAGNDEIPGEAAFHLYATYGLPIEITRDLAGERDFSVDEAGYLGAKEKHAEASGSGAFRQYETAGSVYGQLLSQLIDQGQLAPSGVDYDPYTGANMESEIMALVVDGKSVDRADEGQEVEVITEATPFYVEAGGEVSDTGRIVVKSTGAEIVVKDMASPVNGLILHIGRVQRGAVVVGELAALRVDDKRRLDIRRNHTATHILHRELRAALGSHVTQQGSLVAPDRLRFDFSHGEAVGAAALAMIETAINGAILSNSAVSVDHMPQGEAIGAGAMALFGEKYADVVRTIKIGDHKKPYSFELCGGLHVQSTGDIGFFRFTAEEAVGAGLRRVEAVTGRRAQSLIQDGLDRLQRVSRKLNASPEEIESRLDTILADNKSQQKEIARLRRQQARFQFEQLLDQMEEIDGVPLMAAQVGTGDMDGLREMADWFRDRVQSGVAVLCAVTGDRVILVAVVTDDLIGRGVRAGDLVGQVARMVGGGGGGRPGLAQAGGREPEKLPEALATVPGLLQQALQASSA